MRFGRSFFLLSLGLALLIGLLSPLFQEKSEEAPEVSQPLAEFPIAERLAVYQESSVISETPESLSESASETELSIQVNAAARNALLADLAAAGITVTGRIDALGLIKLADSEAARRILARYLDSGDVTIGNIARIALPPAQPAESNGLPEANASVGFRWRDMIGVSADNASWGDGVTVAVIDGDVEPLPDGSFAHGAEVIKLLQAVAPAATVIAWDVFTDEAGNRSLTASSFAVANAIVAAVDAGAGVINLSLGTASSTPDIEAAVAYAQQRGVTVVAAAGNDGTVGLSYPAALPGVVAVSAVDAANRPASFNNTGNVALAAPGVGVALDENPFIARLSGTSFSAPLVTGGIAAVASEKGVAPSAATKLLSDSANETYLHGNDSATGAGVISLERTLRDSTSQKADLALASQVAGTAFADGSVPVTVVVENRGTEAMSEASLVVAIDGQRPTIFFLGELRAGQVVSREVLLTPAQAAAGASVVTLVESSTPDEASQNNGQASIWKTAE